MGTVDTVEDGRASLSFWRRVNWWKAGCIASLVALELMREIVVLMANQPMQVGVLPSVVRVGSTVVAQGRWKPLQGEDDLVPAAVTIECNAEKRECIQASSASLTDNSFSAPNMSRFPATFTEDGVSFTNDQPACVTYTTRIDLKLEKVLAVRERKSGASPMGVDCSMMEQRLELTLGEGWRPPETGKHFIPLVSGFLWVRRIVD